MKVSLLLVVKDKKDVLRNTLHSIIKQKTSFPYEVCVLDINSSENLAPFIKKIIPDVRYKKLNMDIPFIYTKGICLDLVSSNSDIIVIQGNDVIQVYDFTLEDLCRNVGPKTVSIAEVIDIPVDKDLYKNFEPKVNAISRNWNNYIQCYYGKIDGVEYSLSPRYTGRKSSSILFFLGAIKKDDLNLLNFVKNNCDAVLSPKMKKLGFKINYPDIKGIHQRHPKTSYPCPIVNSCQYYCIRKSRL